MKKKNLSFMTLFMLTATLVGGCSCNKQSDENVNGLVLKVGEKEYSAKDLYNELLSTGTGANEAFAKVLRLVVEQSMETPPNVQASANLVADSFEEEVKTDAATYGTSLEESRKKLLESKGYTSVEQMKADLIYEKKLELITKTYWEDNKVEKFNEYVENRLPYLVRHVLVKVDYSTSANKIANNAALYEDEAKRLVDVIKDLEKEGDFIETAHLYSEDSGSTAVGGAYYMDNTYGANGFVDEFVYGTYAFEAYTTRTVSGDKVTYTFGPDQNKIAKLAGLNDTEAFEAYYKDGFNFVDMSIVNALSRVYNRTNSTDKDYFTISAFEADGTQATGSINETQNYHAKAIIFNQAFNKPGVSVIGYQTEKEAIDAGAKHYVEYKVDGKSRYILADENNNAIFFVAARGSSNSIWVHFLTINVSALSDLENAKKFFTLTPDYEDQHITYVELMSNSDSTITRDQYISELESYVKSYMTNGIGSTLGEESLLKYEMVRHYMEKNNITFMSEALKEAVNSYIDSKKAYLTTKLTNSLSDDWDTHTNKLETSMNELIKKDTKPYECAVLVGSADKRDNPYTVLNYNNDALCRYVYGTGYQVKLNYFYEEFSSKPESESFKKVSTSDNILAFDEKTVESQYVTIGDSSSHYVLPVPQVDPGYIFEGWYTDKDLQNKVAVDNDGDQFIDLSKTSIDNKTIFFAKITKAVSLKYVFVNDSGETVNGPTTNNNPLTVRYNADDESHVVDINLNEFTWEAGATATGIKVARDNQNFNTADLPTVVDLTEKDLTKTLTVYVIVTGDTGGSQE